MDTTESVVAELNLSLGTTYQLARRLTGGLQTGAFELTDHQSRVVLKWSDDPGWAPRVRRADELVRRARAVGYPTPEWLAVGTTAAGSPYQLQEFAVGTPVRDASVIDESLAQQLITVCELQRGLVSDREANWSDYVHGIVFEGWDGMWERLRSYGGEAAELIERYEVLCRPYREVELPADDLVHGDLNVGNLLVVDGQLSGIVDVEAASGGSRAYDLVALATSAARDGAPAGVDALFLEAALQAAGRATVAVCAGSAWASIAAFAREVWPESEEQVAVGARRVLELLDG
ncbi:aminoglycoside phosphotransferase family protein [Kribbella sandramycini]|uniref:Aminoglycoside phosphotransferase (APT) family kinase protein n=1 Tax=Kribbella sandramycini TaxID=60450 RepID=A0A7Y4P1A6_9ACTN|nr:aminoglycoside phosphotransferase family protein [Kribbella sandramycini]MBB6571100.1 aminoglycoside phosphotransferase (APT) family kinase protein [Kribbella sandramycini]NOL43491.1 aminoglycoside phosphotransferase family protein [Kribbella sandramycini]